MAQGLTENWAEVFKNITKTLNKLRTVYESSNPTSKPFENKFESDTSNAWLYILFVLMFYAFSILVLLVKYIRREREGSKLEYYYNEFVKRDWYKDKNLYDKSGRRIHYTVDGTTVTKLQRKSRYLDDLDEDFDAMEPAYSSYSSYSDEDESAKRPMTAKPKGKKSVMLCVGAASILAESAVIGMAPMKNEQVSSERPKFTHTGAVPKRSSLKNWPPCKPAERVGKMSSAFSNSDGFSSNNDDESRRGSYISDYDPVPLPFLQNGNKLMLAKVDERVHRVRSLPPVRSGRHGKRRTLPRMFSDDSQDSLGIPIQGINQKK